MLLSTSNLHLATVCKLHQQFEGLFKVLQRVGKIAYKLDLQVHFTGVHNVFHVSQLRPHVPGGNSTEPPQPVEVEGEALYEVEALLKHRERRGERQYLVKWTGCGPEHDEWVHEGELELAKDMLKNNKEANGLH